MSENAYARWCSSCGAEYPNADNYVHTCLTSAFVGPVLTGTEKTAEVDMVETIARLNVENADLRRQLAEAQAEKRFPIQTGKHGGGRGWIPWQLAERAYGVYSGQYGRGQSLERLAERGGFAEGELDLFIPGWRDELTYAAQLKQAEAENVALRWQLVEADGDAEGWAKQIIENVDARQQAEHENAELRQQLEDARDGTSLGDALLALRDAGADLADAREDNKRLEGVAVEMVRRAGSRADERDAAREELAKMSTVAIRLELSDALKQANAARADAEKAWGLVDEGEIVALGILTALFDYGNPWETRKEQPTWDAVACVTDWLVDQAKRERG